MIKGNWIGKSNKVIRPGIFKHKSKFDQTQPNIDGLPAVVGVENARLIKDGHRIRVLGTKVQLEIL